MICLTVSVGASRLKKRPVSQAILDKEIKHDGCIAPPCPYRRLRVDSLDETLVDAHLVLVPGLGTLTVGGLTGGDVQGLGGQTDGALDLQGLGASTVDQLLADLLERGDLAGGEGDADLVDLL